MTKVPGKGLRGRGRYRRTRRSCESDLNRSANLMFKVKRIDNPIPEGTMRRRLLRRAETAGPAVYAVLTNTTVDGGMRLLRPYI